MRRNIVEATWHFFFYLFYFGIFSLFSFHHFRIIILLLIHSTWKSWNIPRFYLHSNYFSIYFSLPSLLLLPLLSVRNIIYKICCLLFHTFILKFNIDLVLFFLFFLSFPFFSFSSLSLCVCMPVWRASDAVCWCLDWLFYMRNGTTRTTTTTMTTTIQFSQIHSGNATNKICQTQKQSTCLHYDFIGVGNISSNRFTNRTRIK